MDISRRWLRCAVAAAGILAVAVAAPPASGASLGGFAAATAQSNGDRFPQVDQLTWSDSGTHSVSVAVPAGQATGGGSASFGVLRADGGARVDAGTLAQSEAQLSFMDRLTFTSASYTGAAILTYNIVLDGALTAGAGGFVPDAPSADVLSSWRTHFSSTLGGTQDLFGEAQVMVDASAQGGGFQRLNGVEQTSTLFGRVLSVSTSIDLGTAETLQLLLYAGGYSSTVTMNASSANGDFHEVLYWAGITSLTTPEGVAIPFQLTSESGTDYRASFAPPPVPQVPEPTVAMLMACGLLGVLCRGRIAALLARRARRS